MKLLHRWLILSHRYLGLAISALVMVWFASGIVMIYAGGMPRLTPERRIARLPDLDLTRVQLSVAEAELVAREAPSRGQGPDRGGVRLLTVMDRPAYRFGTTTVFADNGEMLQPLDAEQARGVARRFLDAPEAQVRFVATLSSLDQWTLGQSRALPLHKFAVDDDTATEIYIQPRTGEVATVTTRGSRALAWVGVIPHWLYFAALRNNQPVWYRIVVWSSTLACVAAVLGMVLGVVQFRRPRPFQWSRAIPYAGWMRWHYITGLVFGTFTLTWAFSGLLSMEPYAWTNATGLDVPRDVFTGGPVDLKQFSKMDPAAWTALLGGRAIKEVEFARIQDAPYYVVQQAALDNAAAQPAERLHQPYGVTGRANPDRVLVAADTLTVRQERFSMGSLLERLKVAVPDAPIVIAELLPDYDSYYYSRSRQTPLPVIRVKFGDPAETWLYIDPEMSQVVAEVHRYNRIERWLYNGLHSLDFSFWYNRRPLWDIGMIALLLGGFASSAIGFCLGIKRLRRNAARARMPSAAPARTAPSATA